MILLRICHFWPSGCALKTTFFISPTRPWRRLFPLKKTTMYLNDFSKMKRMFLVIFIANNRDNIGLQENHFLKYLKTPQNMTLCTEPSQGLKPMDLGVSWKPLSIKLFGIKFDPQTREKKRSPPHWSHRDLAHASYKILRDFREPISQNRTLEHKSTM